MRVTLLRTVPPVSALVDIDELYRQHAPTVARWAARLGGPGIEVQDVVQDVFLVARRRLQRFDGSANITTWLFRATERIVLAARRQARRRAWLSRTPSDLAPAAPRSRPTPLEAVERDELAGIVYRLLDRLPERQRQVLILFEMEGLSTAEIAALTGSLIATVRVQLHRARARMAELYGSTEAEQLAARRRT
ncbi:MAG TPA: sigma-70 family RNA polymerase sigma factor [Polyangia bacterium]|nr:sigma-70 family RNA polymerase sigma factor [Polyangia bacterium]